MKKQTNLIALIFIFIVGCNKNNSNVDIKTDSTFGVIISKYTNEDSSTTDLLEFKDKDLLHVIIHKNPQVKLTSKWEYSRQFGKNKRYTYDLNGTLREIDVYSNEFLEYQLYYDQKGKDSFFKYYIPENGDNPIFKQELEGDYLNRTKFYGEPFTYYKYYCSHNDTAVSLKFIFAPIQKYNLYDFTIYKVSSSQDYDTLIKIHRVSCVENVLPPQFIKLADLGCQLPIKAVARYASYNNSDSIVFDIDIPHL